MVCVRLCQTLNQTHPFIWFSRVQPNPWEIVLVECLTLHLISFLYMVNSSELQGVQKYVHSLLIIPYELILSYTL